LPHKETALMEFTAVATGGPPVEQLRQALNDIFERLRSAGGRAADFTAMTWSAARPAAFHPSRHEIDLAYREVFGGFRPPIALEPGGRLLTIRAQAVITPRLDRQPLWRQWNFVELERQMSPRSAAVSMREVFAEKRRQGAAFRAAHPDAAYDIAYSAGPNETFDLFYPDQGGGRPLWIFIHGGYWQASDKSDVYVNATQMLAAGYAVATPNYDLCPPGTLRLVIEQMQRFMTFIHAQAGSLGVDPEQIHIAGTSAGGHLAAWLACDPQLPFIRSALAISGLLELEPVALLPAGRILGLDIATAREFSPALRRPNRGVRVGVAVGELESEEFRRQSSEMARQWGASFLEVAGRRHFDVTADLIGGGPLADLALRLAQVSVSPPKVTASA
jgi:arylformamidase